MPQAGFLPPLADDTSYEADAIPAKPPRHSWLELSVFSFHSNKNEANYILRAQVVVSCHKVGISLKYDPSKCLLLLLLLTKTYQMHFL